MPPDLSFLDFMEKADDADLEAERQEHRAQQYDHKRREPKGEHWCIAHNMGACPKCGHLLFVHGKAGGCMYGSGHPCPAARPEEDASPRLLTEQTLSPESIANGALAKTRRNRIVRTTSMKLAFPTSRVIITRRDGTSRTVYYRQRKRAEDLYAAAKLNQNNARVSIASGEFRKEQNKSLEQPQT